MMNLVKKVKITKVVRLCLLLVLLSHFSVGIKALEKKNFNSAHKYFKYGIKSFQRGKLQKAQGFFVKCLSKDISYSPADYYLSQIEYKKKNYKKSLLHIVKAKESYAEYNKIIEGLFQQKNNKNRRHSQNLKDAARMVGEMVNQDNACKTVAVQLSHNQIEKEIANADQKSGGVKNKYIVPFEYYSLHGNIFVKLKQYDLAIQQYKASIIINPRSSEAYNNLASLYMMAGQFHRAGFYIKTAENNNKKINPEFKAKLTELIVKEETLEDNQLLPSGIKRIEHAVSSGFSPIFENTYIVFDPQTLDGIIIDPGNKNNRIDDFITKKKLTIKKILNTHGHSDHIGGNGYYAKKYKAPIFGPIGDKDLYKKGEQVNVPNQYFTNDQVLSAGTLKIQVISIPGHSQGSTCFLINSNLFSGDVIFKGTIGSVIAKNQKSRLIKMNAMITGIREKLLNLDKKILVLSGHGAVSSIGQEVESNPYFNTLNLTKLH